MFPRLLAGAAACAGFLGIGFNRPLPFETRGFMLFRGLSFLGLMILGICVALGLTSEAFADASTTVDFNPLANALTQALVDTATGLIMILGVWLSVELKKKWNIDVTAQVTTIEANSRDTLHSAIETWTKAARAKYPNLSLDVGSPAAKYIIDGVNKSATDAVAQLEPTEEWILAKAAGVLGVPTVPLNPAPAPAAP